MDLEHGLLLGFIGCTITIVGFTIAYMIANHYYKIENRKKEPLTSVQQSLKNLNETPGSKAGDDCQ